MQKHENYEKMIEDDTEFEAQEGWMGECQETFLALEMQAKMYLECLVTKGKESLENSGVVKGKTTSEKELLITAMEFQICNLLEPALLPMAVLL